MCEVNPKRLVPKATPADVGKFVGINEKGRPILVAEGGGGGATEAIEAQARNPDTTNSSTYISPRRLYNALDTFKTSEQTFTDKVTFDTAPNLSSVGGGLVLKTDIDGNIHGVSLTTTDVTETFDKQYMTSAERVKLSALSITYVGTFVSLEALEIAYPTGMAGYEAIIDGGVGEAPVKAFWDDSDNEWYLSSGGGASSFSELAGSPFDNVALASTISSLQPVLGYTPENASMKNENDGYLGLDSDGKFSPLVVRTNSEYNFVSDAEKGIWSSKQDYLGFTPENTSNKNTNNGYVGLDASGNAKLGASTSNARLAIKGDGTNPIQQLETNTGTYAFGVDSLGRVRIGEYQPYPAKLSIGGSDANLVISRTNGDPSIVLNVSGVEAGQIRGVGGTGLRITPSNVGHSVLLGVANSVIVGGNTSDRLVVKGNGVNNIVRFEDNTGTARLTLANDGALEAQAVSMTSLHVSGLTTLNNLNANEINCTANLSSANINAAFVTIQELIMPNRDGSGNVRIYFEGSEIKSEPVI